MNLITGGTGLVGAHLLLFLLEKGEKVRAIYRKETSLKKTENLFVLCGKKELFPQIEWIQADVTDVPALEKAFEGVEFVYHCAAFVSLSSSDEKMRKINIEGTANIVNLCIDFKVKKLCYVSSVAALGDPVEGVISEESVWNPYRNTSDYALSKYGGEIEAFRAAQEGVEVVVVNPGIILGQGFPNQGSSAFFDKVKKGMWFYTRGKSGFVGVSDVVRAMYELMKSPINSEKFILVAENLPFDEFLNLIADSLQVRRPRFYASAFLTHIAAKADGILSFLFRKERALTTSMSKTAHSKTIFSNQKIKETIDFEFTDIRKFITENSTKIIGEN
ncbi:MAG: NAD-dependent epimerase/dehydratase family protein [Flavobacteriaceae bacterium]